MSNPRYNLDGPLKTAISLDALLMSSWQDQWVTATPLLAMIHSKGERNGNFNRMGSYSIKGNLLTIPIAFDIFPNYGVGNAGFSDADEIPSSWPADRWHRPENLTQAEYNWTELSLFMPWSDRDTTLNNVANRASFMDAAMRGAVNKFRENMGTMVEGAFSDTRNTLMGIGFAVAATNVVGGINQASTPLWQSRVQAFAGGVVSLSAISNMADALARNAAQDGTPMGPDLILCANVEGGFNTYNKLRDQILPAERYEHGDFSVRYGIKSFVYAGMTAAQSHRIAGGSVYLLDTSSFMWAGDKVPKRLENQRILGSSAQEYAWMLRCAFMCSSPRRNGRLTGGTS